MGLNTWIKVGYTYFIYNILGYFFKKNPQLHVKTMNMGFAAKDGKQVLLLPEDESEYLQFQLYDYLLKKVNINQKRVVEIGCGVGGGCYYAQKYYQPQKVVGIDLIGVNIEIAAQRYQHLPIQFMQGDACDLVYPYSSADVVINLESSHGYRNFERFVQEVHRILTPGGYMLFADLRYTKHLKKLPHVFEQNQFNVVEFEDISEQVAQALLLDNERKEGILAHSGIGKWLFNNMGFVKGSRYHQYLQNGRLHYILYVLQKR